MHRLTVGLAFLTLGSACIPTALNPDDKVTVTGKAMAQDKSALANASLTLERSAGSACIVLTPFKTLTTDATGAFTLSLTGADTQDGNTARCFRLSAPAGANGATAAVNFLMQVTDVKVPDLQLWNGAVAATQTATGAQLSFDDLSQSHGFNNLSFSLEVKGADGTAWQKSGVSSPVAFSDAVLEDFALTASASTSHEVKGSGTTFTQFFTSDAAALPSRHLVPASRGASCTFTGAPTACPFTDGKLKSVTVGTSDTKVSEILFTLSAPKVLKTAVLRGALFADAASMALEGSADGTTWTKLADVSLGSSYQELALTGGAAVNQVRLKGTPTSGATLSVTTLSELSLFE